MTSMNWAFSHAATTVTARLPLSFLQRCSGRRVCVVLYHAVTDATPDHLKHLLPCRTVRSFRRDLDFLLKHFEPVSLEQLTNGAIHGGPLPENAFHLTCDDGLREAAEVIAPICREKGVPATFFLTTGFLDNGFLWHRHLGSLLLERILQMPERRRELLRDEGQAKYSIDPSASWKDVLITKSPASRPLLDALADLVGCDQAAYLREARPYLDSHDVARLIRDGFTIGAHSVQHPFFPGIAVEEQVWEASESLRQIETSFGVRCRTFAFPFGADGVGPRFYESVGGSHEIDLFFGVGPSGELTANGSYDRIPLDFDSSVAADDVLRRVCANRIRRRFRKLQTDDIRAFDRAQA
jgi:peptidoglycan/xylan/chitin deacetylase (PgdA/CDA1 family)